MIHSRLEYAARVARRVREGGHDVPEAVIRRRFSAGIRNFFGLYQTLADEWSVYDNADDGLAGVAAGHGAVVDEVTDAEAWRRFERLGMSP